MDTLLPLPALSSLAATRPSVARSPSLPARIAQPDRLRFHRAGDPGRDEVERFVSSRFERRYGARVPAWAPILASLSEGDRPVAAAGWRDSADGFYLERYLDEPVERRIGRCAGIEAPGRAAIVEIGHLSGLRAGDGRRLFLRLAAHLATLGFRWVVSTATPGVRVGFARIGIRMFELGPASAARAGTDALAWGRYYDEGPIVVAGALLPNLMTVGGGAE